MCLGLLVHVKNNMPMPLPLTFLMRHTPYLATHTTQSKSIKMSMSHGTYVRAEKQLFRKEDQSGL
jgi:hypothetical protein